MEKKMHGTHKDGEESNHAPQGDLTAEAGDKSLDDAAGVDKIEQLTAALAAREAEAAGNWDKYVRERADLENYRKRVQKEKEEILKYGNESILQEILPVLDNMERALAHACEESHNAVIEGVRMTYTMLLGTLKKFGVTPIETASGTPFDPAFHQAMCQVESAELPANSIVEEFQRGYLLNDRLLRPAMVSVAIAMKNGDE